MVSIVTTTGFGDFAATTTVGRVLSVVLGIYGIVAVAILTSIIVNFYNETKSIQTDQEERPAPDPTDTEADEK